MVTYQFTCSPREKIIHQSLSFLPNIELPDKQFKCDNSPLQGREINVSRFKAFLKEYCMRKEIITHTDSANSYIQHIS